MVPCEHLQLKHELSRWIEQARGASQQLQQVRLCEECGHYLSLRGDGRGGVAEEVWASPAYERWKVLRESLVADLQDGSGRYEDLFQLDLRRIRRNRNEELYQRLPKLRDVLFDSLFD